MTLETFLQGCAGKVTVLAGQAGSGKTLLMYCLGQQWAHGLVSSPFCFSSLNSLNDFLLGMSCITFLGWCKLNISHGTYSLQQVSNTNK